MAVEVKICGLKTAPALDAALSAGADYVGFVFYPRSPRHVDLDTAGRLSALAAGRSRRVALLVDAEDSLISDVVAAATPDLLQLHGAESPERVRAIRQRTGLPVMKVVKVVTATDVAEADAFVDVADRIMFEPKPPDRPGALPGGNGISFDWRILADWRGRWYMLSGGLTPANVAEAIRLTGAPAVDVSSGVEQAPGEKSPDLIARFIQAAKAAPSLHAQGTR